MIDVFAAGPVETLRPDPSVEDGVRRGMYRLGPPPLPVDGPRMQVLASGAAVPWALDARELLASHWGVRADVWSVASWTELRRDALAADRARARGEDRTPYVTASLSGSPGPVLAVSDRTRQAPDRIGQWVGPPYAALGTDGCGPSELRGAAHGCCRLAAESITVAALHQLRRTGAVDPDRVVRARARYGWRA